MIIPKSRYWDAIVDYYYDNIHFEEENAPSIYGWLKREYNADSSLTNPWINFTDDSKLNWFLLKFGEYARN